MKLTPSTTHRILTIPQAALLQCAIRLNLMQPVAVAPKHELQERFDAEEVSTDE